MAKNDKVKWNLDDILKIEDFEKALGQAEKEIEMTERWWNRLSPEMGVDEFADFMEFDEKVDEEFSKLSYLPHLMESTNQKDEEARLMKTKVSDLALRFNQTSRKIGHWIKGLPVEGKKTLDDKNAKRLFASVPDLEYGLGYGRLAAKHTLSQKEEEIIENKDANGGEAISDLRGLIESEMVYTLGKKKIKNQAELLKLVHHKDKKRREAAYRSLFITHKENIDKLFVIYQAIVKDWNFEAKTRGYGSAIEVRNFANHIPDEAVETLLQVCKEERKVFWRYFEYKAKMLRTKKLRRFDLYAPIDRVKEKEYSFEESKKIVLKSFEEFGGKFAEYAKKVFEAKHIDSHPKQNKISGAFCATVTPDIAPYVLLNHTGTSRDVSTLAHELGHAIHSMYASKHSISSQHANLPLSETASTLAEMILFEKMLQEEKDKKVKKQMLWEKIGEAYATILRQNYFVMFEIEAHKRLTEGTTAKELSKIYLENLKEQFGPGVVIDPIFKYEWLYISHIFESPFYCYAYNFGELLSLALYGRYKKDGARFISKIEAILEAGGSRDPMEILIEVGINIGDKNFWKQGWEIIESWQKQLEAL